MYECETQVKKDWAAFHNTLYGDTSAGLSITFLTILTKWRADVVELWENFTECLLYSWAGSLTTAFQPSHHLCSPSLTFISNRLSAAPVALDEQQILLKDVHKV